jgi:hypothetical protein
MPVGLTNRRTFVAALHVAVLGIARCDIGKGRSEFGKVR